MKEFSTLKEAARIRRDKIIKQANREYEATVKRITDLAADLLGVDANRRTTADVVNSVIPQAGTFTIGDILESLEASEPNRIWNEASVVNHLARLREKGVVKRVRRARRSERAIYARAGVKVESPPFDDMTLAQVIAEVIADREPLRIADIAVAVLEAGYDTIMSPKSFRHAVGTELKAHDRFVRDGQKWHVSTKTPG